MKLFFDFRKKGMGIAIICWILFFPGFIAAQGTRPYEFIADQGLWVVSAEKSSDPASLGRWPLFSCLLDGRLCFPSSGSIKPGSDSLLAEIGQGIILHLKMDSSREDYDRIGIRILNESDSIHTIENLVPFGESLKHAHITAAGTREWPQYLCRSRLMRPGYSPVGVLLPDNLWHLGWADIRVGTDVSLSALARRGARNQADADRWTVTLKPGGSVEYSIYLIAHAGDWRNGLEQVFRNHYCFDLDSFDNRLFQRKDLQWVRGSYLMLLQFAWDKTWYDAEKNSHTFYQFFNSLDQLTGGWDIYTLWPTWPRLGLDPQNQFDLYRNLPGGMAEIRNQADFLHRKGKKYFISYNPWDESTRKEVHLEGLERLLRETGTDGVVLDTRGESSRELQAVADNVKPGIIMYSEGMAIPRHMPGIVSGRVHNALYMPPVLNLNKFIKPDFAIFRVIDLAENEFHREICLSFFNGYGIEINTMRPGRPDRYQAEFRFMGETTRILRENTSVFNDLAWNPLVDTRIDSIWVNQWKCRNKELYTIFSLQASGFAGPMFRVFPDKGFHFVSLFSHQECRIDTLEGQAMVVVSTGSFSPDWIGTRKEGAVECIARLPEHIQADHQLGILSLSAGTGDELRIWAGDPSYSKSPLRLVPGDHRINLRTRFPGHDDKYVIQLFGENELLDEVIIPFEPGTPVLVSPLVHSPASARTPEGMCKIPAADITLLVRRDSGSLEPFIPFPKVTSGEKIHMPGYFIDKYPVTNRQFHDFLLSSSYRPKDTTNFLRHWNGSVLPKELENHPVVYISPADAEAYARWAGKRLPTELEWQYAGQGSGGSAYPWGEKMDSTACNYKSNKSTAVDQFPEGRSPFGVCDMIGNVWQLTADEYDNGSYRYRIIRGGSHYFPDSSIWYVRGGPVSLFHPEMLLRISDGFDRCSTIGFRCVKDTY